MTALESLAAWLLLPVFLACLWRARLLALAIIPPLALALVQWLELADTSSAYHPLRWLVPAASSSVALWSMIQQAELPRTIEEAKSWVLDPRMLEVMDGHWHRTRLRNQRILVASILVFASGCADIPALLAWSLPGEWVLVPLQIAVCLGVIGVLVAPERWFHGR